MNPFLLRRIRGPVFLLTFAVTALLAQNHVLSFAKSWPLYLLVAGVLRLLETALPPALAAGLARLPSRRSFTGGSVVLSIGAAALLLTTGALDSQRFFLSFARWWPLTLIAVGLLLLVERVFDRSYSTRALAAGYAPPRRRSGGLGLLVFLLVALGLTNPGAHMLPHEALHWGENDFEWDWGGMPFGDGEAHENQVTLDEAIPPTAALVIDNARGDVEVAPSTDGRIHVTARQTTHGPERDAAGAFAATRPALSVHGSSATLTVAAHPRTEVNLEVTLPPGIEAELRTHHGEASVSGLSGALTVHSDHGNVNLDNLRGPARLEMDHGDLRARTLDSDLTVDGRTGDVAISGLRGRATLHGEFFGGTQIAGAAGPVSFHSNKTILDLGRLGGSLSLDGENLRISDPSGGLTLQTRSKEVEITGLLGAASVEDANSDVSVALAAGPVSGPISVRNDTGDITLSAPPGASFTLAGSTGTEDDIRSDFPFAQTTEGGRKTIAGQQGAGGPSIALQTKHGDLTVRRAGPAKPERRLRANGEVPAPVAQ